MRISESIIAILKDPISCLRLNFRINYSYTQRPFFSLAIVIEQFECVADLGLSSCIEIRRVVVRLYVVRKNLVYSHSGWPGNDLSHAGMSKRIDILKLRRRLGDEGRVVAGKGTNLQNESFCNKSSWPDCVSAAAKELAQARKAAGGVKPRS